MFTSKSDSKKRRHLRIRKKINGTLARPRLVVYRSLSHIHAQIVNDEKSTVLVSASDLKSKSKGTKTEKAKEVGMQVAKLAKEKGVNKVVFDRNGCKYHGRVKAVADGAREEGLQF
ncbi:MAG: 50S ribosomal protein L18 [Patescibacteria group bacterium]